MDLIEEKHDEVIIFRLGGRLDSTTSSMLEEKITEAFKNGVNKIILNLKNIEYISSAGLRVFKKIRAAQGPDDTIILCSVADYIQEFIELSGVDIYLPIVGTKEEALKKI